MKVLTTSLFLLSAFSNQILSNSSIKPDYVYETNQLSVNNADATLIDYIHNTDFYEFKSNDIIYYVAKAENQDSNDKYLIRTTEDFSKDILLSDYCIDYSKKMIEIQHYNSIENSFNQSFNYITDDEFTNIKNKSIILNQSTDEDIRIEILSSFQYQFDYLKNKFKENTSKGPKRVPQIGQAFNSDTDEQAKLDNYINTNGSYTKTNTLYVNRETKNTIDDSIVSLIPKQYFTTTCTKTNFGTEWGYYIDTYSISSYGVYTSEVFIFDIKIEQGNEKNVELVTLCPITNATFIYRKNTDIVSYYQENTFCIMKPQYASNIRYVSDYVMIFNDYDETEYVPINEHPLNPDENGYKANLDEGMFFDNNGFVAETTPSYNIKKNINEFIIDSSKSILLNLIPDPIASTVIGKIIDGFGLLSDKIYTKIKNEANENKFLASKFISEKKDNKIYYNYCKIYNGDISISNENKRKHKFICYDLSNDEEFKLINKDDYISFFSYIKTINKESLSYKALISHGIGFDLCKIRGGSISKINHFFNNIGYLYQPSYQTEDKTIFTSYAQKPLDIHLAQSTKTQETNVNIEQDGTYLFNFTNLASGVHIYFSSGEHFYSGTKNKKLLNSNNESNDIVLPEHDNLNLTKYLLKGTQLKIKFLRSIGTAEDETGYYSANISMFIYKLEDNSITNFSNNVSSLDNTFNSYITSSKYKTIKLTPKIRGFYTFYMNDDSGTTLFTITDSRGRTLFDTQTPVSSKRCILNLNHDDTYYIHFVSYQAAHKVSFIIDKNRYIYSTIETNYDFNYQQMDSSDFTYLFNPSKDTRLNLSVPTNSDSVIFRIYDDKRRLLKTINNPIGFDYNFSANKLYYLQMQYLTSDKNILSNHLLRIRRMN